MINSLIDALRPFKSVSFTFDLLLSIYHRYDFVDILHDRNIVVQKISSTWLLQ